MSNKKQTPLQKVIELLNKRKLDFPENRGSDKLMRAALHIAIQEAQALLPEERTEIEGAFTKGQLDIADTVIKDYVRRGILNEAECIDENDGEDAKEYFSSTYLTEEDKTQQ